MSDEAAAVSHKIEKAPNGAYYLSTQVNGHTLGITFIGNTLDSLRNLGDLVFSVVEVIAQAEEPVEAGPVKE